jgi:hypothetical protein
MNFPSFCDEHKASITPVKAPPLPFLRYFGDASDLHLGVENWNPERIAEFFKARPHLLPNPQRIARGERLSISVRKSPV